MTKMKAAAAAIESRLIDDWWAVLKRSWAVRGALLAALLNGIILVWTVFEDKLPMWAYVSIGIALNLAVVALRIIKQPGADE